MMLLLLLYRCLLFVFILSAHLNRADVSLLPNTEANMLKDSLTGMFNYARQPNSKSIILFNVTFLHCKNMILSITQLEFFFEKDKEKKNQFI